MFSKAVRTIRQAAQKLMRGQDPAERAVSADFVRSAYRVLLHREVESPAIVDGVVASGTSEAKLVLRILRSAEFSLGTVATRLVGDNWQPQDGQQLAKFAALLDRFEIYRGPGQPGFYMDFLGTRARTRYVPGMYLHDNRVLPPPIEEPSVLFEVAEWEATLRSALEAKDRFVAIELGAGWAPWLVNAHAAARQRGITDIALAGVEASAEHFAYMAEHLRDNGIDPDQQFLFEGVVGKSDGFAHFPRLPDASRDWGAQAVIGVDQSVKSHTGSFVDYRGLTFETMDRVPCIALATLLRRYPRIDLVHCDIQDSEGEVLPSAIDELCRRVRRVVVGTHSRKSEGALLEVFTARGWALESDKSCQYVVEGGRIGLLRDGLQVWANLNLPTEH